jgi:signal transduction histidine kinase
LQEFVLELLDASRLEGSGLVDPARYETVNLGELAQQVCDPDRADRARCKVEAPEAVVGEFDAARVRQLVENLVENALKYSPRGEGVLVRVWQDADAAGGGPEQAHVAVLDHGIGIPAQDLPNVFERFHRGRNVDDRRFAGLGLGLYICKGIAEQHGGRIWAESTPGMGSTFHVVLPLSREPREQAGVDEAKAAA